MVDIESRVKRLEWQLERTQRHLSRTRNLIAALITACIALVVPILSDAQNVKHQGVRIRVPVSFVDDTGRVIARIDRRSGSPTFTLFGKAGKPIIVANEESGSGSFSMLSSTDHMIATIGEDPLHKGGYLHLWDNGGHTTLYSATTELGPFLALRHPSAALGVWIGSTNHGGLIKALEHGRESILIAGTEKGGVLESFADSKHLLPQVRVKLSVEGNTGKLSLYDEAGHEVPAR